MNSEMNIRPFQYDMTMRVERLILRMKCFSFVHAHQDFTGRN